MKGLLSTGEQERALPLQAAQALETSGAERASCIRTMPAGKEEPRAAAARRLSA